MMKKPLIFLLMLLSQFSGFCQEVDVDELFREALQEYRDGNYSKSLELTSTGLDLAPDYHDIRVLQVRNKYALQQFEQSDVDLKYLLSKAPTVRRCKIAFHPTPLSINPFRST